jgi:hypothetical protein
MYAGVPTTLAPAEKCRRHRTGPSRHAEIDQFGVTGSVDQDIAWLEVAVNDVPLVGVGHRLAHLQERMDDPAHQFTPGRHDAGRSKAARAMDGRAA